MEISSSADAEPSEITSTHREQGARRARPTTVVLVDDESLIRDALGRALSEGGLELVGEAANAPDAIRVVADLRPDVVLMDLRFPGRAVSTRSRSSACSPRPRAY